MGDGNEYFHKEDQIKISCYDCHPKNLNDLLTASIDNLENESQLIIGLRNIKYKSGFVKAGNSNFYYPNIIKKENDLVFIQKNTNKESKLTLQNKACSDISGHKDLDCKACHTAWSPNCVGCHTNFDITQKGWNNLTNTETKGAWVEHEGKFLNDKPSLGVIEKGGKRTITTFSPGMIINLNKSIRGDQQNVFKRLYSPVSPHTISKESRDCQSCHFSSNALGYGRGLLVFKDNKISFISSNNFIPDDNLPEDSWIPFLKNSISKNTTRENARSFNIIEQQKILTVGICLTCHKINDSKLEVAFNDMKNYKKYISKKCKTPIWN
jgi:hypothetical protein